MKTQFDITKAIFELDAKKIGLTTVERAILLQVTHYLGEHNGVFKCWPSHSKVASKVGTDRKKVGQTMAKLVKMKVFSCRARATEYGGQTSNEYTWIGLPKEVNKEAPSVEPTAKKDVEAPVEPSKPITVEPKVVAPVTVEKPVEPVTEPLIDTPIVAPEYFDEMDDWCSSLSTHRSTASISDLFTRPF